MSASELPLVAVLGATGTLGGEVCRLLPTRLPCTILACGRDRERLKTLERGLGGAHRTLALDLTQPDPEAGNTLAACDIVINCTGPSWRTAIPAAEAALGGRGHFVDPGGYAMLERHLASRHAGLVKDQRSFIIGAGWMPGLAELAARQMLDKALGTYGEQMRELDLFFGARDHWPLTSVSDMIWHLFELPHSLGWFEDGVWKKAGINRMGVRVNLPGRSGRERATWVYNAPFACLAREYPRMRIRAGMLFVSPLTQAAIAWISLFCRSDRARAARILQRAIGRDADRRGIEGLVWGRGVTPSRRRLSCLIRTGRNMEMTAFAVVEAARHAVAGSAGRGALYFDRAVPPGPVFTQLAQREGTLVDIRDENDACRLRPTAGSVPGRPRAGNEAAPIPDLPSFFHSLEHRPAQATALLDMCSRAHGSALDIPWVQDPVASFLRIFSGVPPQWKALHPLCWMGVCSRTLLLDRMAADTLAAWSETSCVSVWSLGAGFDGRWARHPLMRRQGLTLHEWDDARILEAKRIALSRSPWSESYARVEAHPWRIPVGPGDTAGAEWEKSIREEAERVNGPVMVVMEGLLDLLPLPTKKRLLRLLAKHLPDSVLLFDNLNETAARNDNKAPERYTGSRHLPVQGLAHDAGELLMDCGWLVIRTESVFETMRECPLAGRWKALRLFPLPSAMREAYCCRAAIPFRPLFQKETSHAQ